MVSYNTFLTEWRGGYKQFTDLSPTRHKLVQIIKVLTHYNIIRQTKRGSNTPIYTIGTNNPYHPNYKPIKIKYPVGHKTTNSQGKSASKVKTLKELRSDSDGFEEEYDDILKDRKEDQ
jgi:hypothetical protein